MYSLFRVRIIVPAAAICLSGLLLAYPQAVADGFSQGLAICLHALLPALFPFFITCRLVVSACDKKGGFWMALLLSWLGGYAICAGLIRDLHEQGKISSRQSQALLLLGCCSGPGFVIGSVGGQILGSVFLGIVLYASQLLANLICAIIFLPAITRYSTHLPDHRHTDAAAMTAISLPSAISSAVNSCLCVCGTVLFFRIIHALLQNMFPAFPSPLLSALLEVSAGCSDFAQVNASFVLPGIALCLSVLSLSVFTQLHALLRGAADLRLLLCTRLVHIPIMLLLVRAGTGLFPREAAVFSSLAPRVIFANRVSPDAAFVVFLFLCAVLYKIHRKNYNELIHR